MFTHVEILISIFWNRNASHYFRYIEKMPQQVMNKSHYGHGYDNYLYENVSPM